MQEIVKWRKVRCKSREIWWWKSWRVWFSNVSEVEEEEEDIPNHQDINSSTSVIRFQSSQTRFTKPKTHWIDVNHHPWDLSYLTMSKTKPEIRSKTLSDISSRTFSDLWFDQVDLYHTVCLSGEMVSVLITYPSWWFWDDSHRNNGRVRERETERRTFLKLDSKASRLVCLFF